MRINEFITESDEDELDLEQPEKKAGPLKPVYNYASNLLHGITAGAEAAGAGSSYGSFHRPAQPYKKTPDDEVARPPKAKAATATTPKTGGSELDDLIAGS